MSAPLVDIASRTYFRNDNIKVFYEEKNAQAANPSRALIPSALKEFRVLLVERIGLEFFKFLSQPVTGRYVAPLKILFGRAG